MKFRTDKLVGSIAAALFAASGTGVAHSASLLDGLGGASGYGEIALAPNDDASSSLLNLPFSLNFFGSTHDTFYVNNNGNITFNSPLSTFTPRLFPIANQSLIAPWWADVDTRNRSGLLSDIQNNVYVASPNADTVVVTWHDVGYFSSRNDKLNNFQLVLRNRADTGTGNFDFDFRYEQLEWTTGDASGGTGGLGGTNAQAGYDDGTGRNFFTLPGSFTANVLNVQNNSNVSANTPGLWTFAVRNGQTPGGSASNPLLPVLFQGGFFFNFNVALGQQVFVDPVVAVGYDYLLTDDDSPSFASVLLPNIGDGVFDLSLWNGTEYVVEASLTQGVEYTFDEGVRGFRITGIEVDAALDPNDVTAFVTGLTFNGTGAVALSQTPITVTTPVPEPSSYALMGLGLAAMGWGLRRRRMHAHV